MDDLERCMKGGRAPAERRRLDVVLVRVLWVTAAAIVLSVVLVGPSTSAQAGQSKDGAHIWRDAPTNARIEAIGSRVETLAERQASAAATLDALIERLKAIEDMNVPARLARIELSNERQEEIGRELRGLFYMVLGGVLILIITQILNLKESAKHRRRFIDQSTGRAAAEE